LIERQQNFFSYKVRSVGLFVTGSHVGFFCSSSRRLQFLLATQILFSGVETNGPLNRIITLVVVPPSGEQLVDLTNLTVQPNIIIKPNGTTNYPVVAVVPADYDVYLAGLKQVFESR